MTRALWATAFFAALAGCNCGTTGGTNTSPVRGIIVGRVTDALTGAPLASVVVKAQADTQVTASTDGDGVFTIRDLPLGYFTVSFELAGYVRALCSAYLDVTSTTQGNILATCDMSMARAEGKLEGFVVTPDGKPVGGLTLLADLRSTSGPNLYSGYDLVATSTTAADGSFAFAALPAVPRGASVVVYFPPFDLNGDGEPEAGGFTRTFTVYPGPAAPVVVVLANNAPSVVVTNLFDNELAPGEAMTVTWSTPLDTASAVVTLVDQTRNTEVPLEKTWSSGLTLTARPSTSTPLREGSRYQLTVTARAVGTNAAGGGTWSFNFVLRPSSINPITSQVSNLAVTAPLTPAHSTTGFTLGFTGAAGAAGYKVYAKDTQLNRDWILVSAFTGSNSGTVYQAFTLPAQFDAYLFDGATRWPLANGNRITFAVVPFDAFGNESPLSAAATVQVQDQALPTWVSIGSQVGDAVNDTSQPTRVIMPFTFSEPMKPSVSPQLVTASNLTATWTWANDYQSGYFTVTIPANSNGAEGFIIRGGEDQNGNRLSNGEAASRFVGIQDLLTNSGFEEGGCSLTGWTPGTTGGPPTLAAPIAQGNTFATSVDPASRCAAAIGSINGSPAGVGTSRLSQQFTTPAMLPAGRGLVMRVNYRLASDASPVASGGAVRCGVMDAAFTAFGTMVLSSTGGTNQSGFTFTTVGVTLTPSTTYQFVCEAALAGANPAEFGVWVDDVQLGVAFN